MANALGQWLKKWWPVITTGLGGLLGGTVGAVVGGPAGIIPGAAKGAGLAGSAATAGKTIQNTVTANGKPAQPGAQKEDTTQGKTVNYDLFDKETKEMLQSLDPSIKEKLQSGDFRPLQELITSYIKDNNLLNPEQIKPLVDKLTQTLTQQAGYNPNEQVPQAGSYYENLLKGKLNQEPGKYSFEPIREAANKNFKEQTLPSLAERFTAFGQNAQRTGAFQGAQERAAAEHNTGLTALESEYNRQNRQLDQQDIQTLAQILGQQQNFGINQGQLGLQGQQNAINFLNNQQGKGLQSQELAQGLLGQEQRYNLGQQGVGTDILRSRAQPTFGSYYQPGTPDFWQNVTPQIAKSIIDVLGQLGGTAISNKYNNAGQQQQPYNYQGAPWAPPA